MANIESVKGRVSPEEWQTRVDLAAAYRLVAMYGWDDIVFTHITAKVPANESGQEEFLINPYGQMFEEISASSLVKINIQGEKVMDSPFPIVMHSHSTKALPCRAKKTVCFRFRSSPSTCWQPWPTTTTKGSR